MNSIVIIEKNMSFDRNDNPVWNWRIITFRDGRPYFQDISPRYARELIADSAFVNAGNLWVKQG